MEYEEKCIPGKKRKRRSFMMNVKKKFGKSGGFARGSHIEEDTFQYFIRVLELERQEFDSLDDKKIFANNALDQTVGHEIEYSSNQLVSRVLENLLPLASEVSLTRFLDVFGKDLRPICGDMFASHILQKLLVLATKQAIAVSENPEVKQEADTYIKQEADTYIKQEADTYIKQEADTYIKQEADAYIKQEPGSHSNNCYKWVIKVGKFMINNLEDFVWERNGNHIIRTLFHCLSGTPDSGKDSKQHQAVKTENATEKFVVPKEFTDLFVEFINRLMSWPQFPDFAYEELTSGLLQVSLKTMKSVDSKLNKTVMRKLLTDVYYKYNTDGTLDVSLFEKSPAVHLLECIIETCNKKLYSKLFAKFFVNNLSTLAQLGPANFTVQKLINKCVEKSDCEIMMDELCPYFSDILKCKHTGVLLSLCQACERVSTRQMDFIKGLAKALNLESEERHNILAIHIIKMVSYSRESEVNSLPISLHGSLILQSMLRFKKPIKIVNSILSIEPSVLSLVFCDPRGSHIMDTFISAEFVGEKSRERLVRHLKGFYVTMAVSKHGSRSFDKIWQSANLKHKSQIAAELISKESKIMSNDFGKFVALKTALSTFRHNPNEWKNAMSQSDKTKKLFADIIGDSSVK